jgi:hypothetical protein
MHANTRTVLWKTSCLGLALVGALHGTPIVLWSADEAPAEPKSIRKTCGKCPDGYTTGVTQSPEICKGRCDARQCPARGEHAAGLRVLPGGYREIGLVHTSSLRKPRRRTSVAVSIRADGAQSSRSDSRGKVCPPDCGAMPAPARPCLRRRNTFRRPRNRDETPGDLNRYVPTSR